MFSPYKLGGNGMIVQPCTAFGAGGLYMLSLEFEVALRCLYLIGTVLSDSGACKPRETGEPSLVYCSDPGADGWCS